MLVRRRQERDVIEELCREFEIDLRSPAQARKDAERERRRLQARLTTTLDDLRRRGDALDRDIDAAEAEMMRTRTVNAVRHALARRRVATLTRRRLQLEQLTGTGDALLQAHELADVTGVFHEIMRGAVHMHTSSETALDAFSDAVTSNADFMTELQAVGAEAGGDVTEFDVDDTFVDRRIDELLATQLADASAPPSSGFPPPPAGGSRPRERAEVATDK